MSQTDAPARPAKAAMPVNLLAFRPVRKPGSSIRGFAHVQIGALKISDVMILQKDGRAWANMPSKPRMTREGPHALTKSLTWGDGAATELFELFKQSLRDYLNAH